MYLISKIQTKKNFVFSLYSQKQNFENRKQKRLPNITFFFYWFYYMFIYRSFKENTKNVYIEKNMWENVHIFFTYLFIYLFILLIISFIQLFYPLKGYHRTRPVITSPCPSILLLWLCSLHILVTGLHNEPLPPFPIDLLVSYIIFNKMVPIIPCTF